MIYKTIKLGADPELFLQKKNGVYVPCINLIGGTKEQPRVISDAGHAVQEDNVMVEFNIPPSTTEDEFLENIQHSLRFILDEIGDDLDIVAIPSAEFEWNVLDHPQAYTFGCDPYVNAYTRREEHPEGLRDSNVRFAGGHIHIGYDNPNAERSENLVKALDLFLGVPSLILDKDKRRRATYGKAGNFRFKDYGVEYRSLSNFWVASDDLIRWTYRNTMKAIQFLNEGNQPPEQIQNIINNGDNNKAEEIIRRYKISA